MEGKLVKKLFKIFFLTIVMSVKIEGIGPSVGEGPSVSTSPTLCDAAKFSRSDLECAAGCSCCSVGVIGLCLSCKPLTWPIAAVIAGFGCMGKGVYDGCLRKYTRACCGTHERTPLMGPRADS